MKSPELTVLSYGCGQDSWTLLLKYVHDEDFRSQYAPGKFLVVMADTNDEHPRTLEHLEYTKTFCSDHNIEFVHITADMGHHLDTWLGLREFYNRTTTVGSKAYPKTCTDKLKLRPIYDFLETWISKNYGYPKGRKAAFKAFAQDYGKINMLIGIAKGEEKRCADPTKDTMKWRKESIKTLYPLINLGLDRQGCQEYMKSLNEVVPPPSNCVLCPFMNDVELLWLYRFMPDHFEDWVRIERNKMTKWAHLGDKNLGVWGKKTLPEVLAEAIEKHGHMTNTDLEDYKMSHGHCVMSKY